MNKGERLAPNPGEIFRQLDLYNTLNKLIEAEDRALAKECLEKKHMAANDRFYKGDIAEEIARSTQEQGGQSPKILLTGKLYLKNL